ncbi:MAG TPA: TetR/AcrR family transcriptional regulator [Gammaproteobacteria bacterium]
MARTSDKRERLIEAAKTLIHRKGFHSTTLADIAAESKVPLGNVYYYFKTKDEICQAVIDERKKELTGVLDLCCKKADPKMALKKLLKYTTKETKELDECGCPYMGLVLDLDRADSRLTPSADQCVRVLIEWAGDQFKALGYENAMEMGFEFIARVQGTVLLGHALHDKGRMRRQLNEMCGWVDALQDAPAPGQVTIN